MVLKRQNRYLAEVFFQKHTSEKKIILTYSWCKFVPSAIIIMLRIIVLQDNFLILYDKSGLAIPCYTLLYLAIPCYILLYLALLCYTLLYFAVFCSIFSILLYFAIFCKNKLTLGVNLSPDPLLLCSGLLSSRITF